MTSVDLLGMVTILLGTGVIAGILAGLLGVGGGIVLVPAFVLILDIWGYQGTQAMQLAVATSLLTIIVTSARSVLAHHKRGAVDLDLLKRLAFPVVLGAVTGMLLAQRVQSVALMGAFGVLGTGVGLYMAIAPGIAREGARLPRPPVFLASSTVLGALSALIGIGGGSFFVPYLTFFGRSPHSAVATSAGIGILIALPATLGFVLVSSGAGAPPLTLGLVNLPAALIVVSATMVCAPLGVTLAHRMNAKRLKRAFGCFLTLTAGRMLLTALGVI